MSDVWAEWQGQVIQGVFPLRRLIGASDHSGVFLTEFAAGNLPNAALKLVPALPTLTEAQLSHWMAASALSHPHLIRILDSGRCQLGGRQFLFVVMEYAEQTLAEILPQRALTPDETREMLLPVLSALGFLHRNGLVQGQLKPANILVVGSQLKLASDAIRLAGEAAASIAQPSVYDPPEARDGSFSVAGDVWGLGVTAVEALTQHQPAWLDDRFNLTSLPPTLPPRLVGIVRQCLNRDPTKRPTVADLEARLTPMTQQAPGGAAVAAVVVEPAAFESTSPGPTALASTAPERAAPEPAASAGTARTRSAMESIPGPVAHEALGARANPETPAKRGWGIAALVVGIVAVAAIWFGSRGARNAPDTDAPRETAPAAIDRSADARAEDASQGTLLVPVPARAPGTATASGPAPSRPTPRASDKSARSPAHDSPGVIHEELPVHEEIPTVSRTARETIHGRVKVSVRVTVDNSGRVIATALQNPGPSRYFARLATEAAKKWQFAPANNPGSREQVLEFEFARSGTSGHVMPPRS